MIYKYKNRVEESGVSPVVGLILLTLIVFTCAILILAILTTNSNLHHTFTVALIAILLAMIFNIFYEFYYNKPDAKVRLNELENGVEATVIQNRNVDTFKFQYENKKSIKLNSVSNSKKLMRGDGTYTVIAILKNGTKEVITSTYLFNDEYMYRNGAELNTRIIDSNSNTVEYNGYIKIYIAETREYIGKEKYNSGVWSTCSIPYNKYILEVENNNGNFVEMKPLIHQEKSEFELNIDTGEVNKV